jgi:sugar O-acyltransferase (sialic acid O-acetyltransferase NeuD family)
MAKREKTLGQGLKKLVILGMSGNALDMLDVVDAINAVTPTWEIIGILDARLPDNGRFMGYPILGGLQLAVRLDDCWFINAIGSDRSYIQRPEIIADTGVDTHRFATLIHPRASISVRAKIGRGVCVQYGACIASNVTVEDHVLVGPGCILGHDCMIGAYSVLAPGAMVSGSVCVETSCYLGAGCMIRQGLHVGDQALVGMGAVVIRTVAEKTVVVGNPARLLRR